MAASPMFAARSAISRRPAETPRTPPAAACRVASTSGWKRGSPWTLRSALTFQEGLKIAPGPRCPNSRK
eukprot:9422607-Pyramimonas_sp.AAC.1